VRCGSGIHLLGYDVTNEKRVTSIIAQRLSLSQTYASPTATFRVFIPIDSGTSRFSPGHLHSIRV
ncbi:MAG: hypothetical protein J7460_08885, partial [Chloroflexus sp.]|nr:hypothetical protein [Chloroflexus sp.]